jgi:hypothetical protein
MIRKGNPAGPWKQFMHPSPNLVKKAKQMFPKKKVIGTFTYQGISASGRKKVPGVSCWSYQTAAPAFWADGKRSVYEIWRNVCCEFNKPESLGRMIKLFEFLDRNDFVEM